MASNKQTREPLTQAEYRVYQVIRRHNRTKPDLVLRQIDIARKLGVKAPWINQVVRSLETKKWLPTNSGKNLARAI